MFFVTENKTKWNFYLKKHNLDSVSYTYEFTRAFYDGAKLGIYEDKGKVSLLCFTIKEGKLNGLRYGGMISNNKSSDFKKKSEKIFYDFLKNKKIKKYQIRNNPFLSTIKIGREIKKEPFIFVDLTKSEEELKGEISKGHLKSIKKAKNENLKMFETSDMKYLPIFYKLHKNQLKLKKVKPQNYSFFKRMFSYLSRNLSFICIIDNDEIIAVSLILKDKHDVFMIYGGMNKKGYSKCAKHLMIYSLMFKFKKKGYSRLILGTGNKGKDAIYKFKKGFVNEENYLYTYGGTI